MSTWTTDAGDLDVLVFLPGPDGARRLYEGLALDARRIDYEGVAVQVAGLGDIIASKEWRTGRRTLKRCQRAASASRPCLTQARGTKEIVRPASACRIRGPITALGRHKVEALVRQSFQDL